MAKENKKAALSMEERLDAALVPDWEQPYKVPANWCWTHVGNYIDYATDYVANGSFASLKANVRLYKEENYALMVKTADFSNDFSESLTYTDKHGYDYLSKSKLYGGELILSNIGSIGKVFRVPKFNRPMTLAPNSIMIKCHRDLDYDWLYYYFLSPMGYDSLRSITTGTALLKFNKTQLKELPIAIPPLAEQQRIVDRIESLFAKLDEAKEKAQEVVDGYDARRAAILHKAFTGELTAEWAEQEELSAERWKSKRFDGVAEVKSNLVDPADYQSFPHIAPDNIEKKAGRLLEYHTIAEDGVKSGKHRFFAGQILYSKIRPYLSKAIVVDFDGLCSADMYPIEPKEGLDTKYLWYYMLSEEFLTQASTAGSRSVLPKINQKELANLTVQVTDIREQKKIVAILDILFAREQQAKEAAEQVIYQIDTMKKSILARAFRGELGTNDPTDDSAIDLLKAVLGEDRANKEEAKPAKKRVNVPSEIDGKLGTTMERDIVKLFYKADTTDIPIRQIMSISSKKFELMDALRALEKKAILKKNDTGSYSLVKQE